MQVLLRSEEENLTVNVSFDKEMVRQKAIEHFEKKHGKKPVVIEGISRKVQVSLNSDGRLVVRLMPVVTALIGEGEDRTEDFVIMQSPDVLVVLDREETEKVVAFVHNLQLDVDKIRRVRWDSI